MWILPDKSDKEQYLHLSTSFRLWYLSSEQLAHGANFSYLGNPQDLLSIAKRKQHGDKKRIIIHDIQCNL